MIKIIQYDCSEVGRIHARLDNAKQFIGIPYCQGVPIADRCPTPLVVRRDMTQSLPDYFPAGPLPIISELAKHAIEQCECDAEFIPAIIDAKSDLSYFLLNVLSRADCLDRKESQYTRAGNYYTRLTRLVLADSAIVPGIFAIQYVLPQCLAIRKPFFDTIAPVRGLKLVTPDNHIARAINI